MSRVSILNDINFNDSIMKTSGLVVVLFWAPWCGHCDSIINIIEELSNEMHNVTFVSVNKDDGLATTRRFDIGSIPFLLFFKNGKIVDKQLGSMEKEALRHRINNM